MYFILKYIYHFPLKSNKVASPFLRKNVLGGIIPQSAVLQFEVVLRTRFDAQLTLLL